MKTLKDEESQHEPMREHANMLRRRAEAERGNQEHELADEFIRQAAELEKAVATGGKTEQTVNILQAAHHIRARGAQYARIGRPRVQRELAQLATRMESHADHLAEKH